MWSDVETRQDFLNYAELAEVVADLLSDPKMLPLSVGVSGGWGTGKSSMLNLIEAKLPDDTPERKFVVVRFDAWLYQGYDDARAALMEAIASRLVDEAKHKDKTIVDKAKGLLKRVDKMRLLGLMGEAGAAMAGFPAFGFISKATNAASRIAQGETDPSEIKDLKEAGAEAKKTTHGLFKPEEEITPPQQIDAFRTEFGKVLGDLNATLVVFIDNLDRCLPQQTIHTLEALRLFLFMSNTAFCVAADEDMIRHSVSEHFKTTTTDHLVADYLDKLIQIPVRVPRLGVQEIRSYLFLLFASASDGVTDAQVAQLRETLGDNLRQAWSVEPLSVRQAMAALSVTPPPALAAAFDMADRMAPLLANSSAVGGNPRIIKRLLNTVRIRAKIAKLRRVPVEETLIAKLALFERCMGEGASVHLYSTIQTAQDGRPELFEKLQSATTPETFAAACPSSWQDKEHLRFLQEWIKLEPLLAGQDLRPTLHLSRDTVALVGRRRGLSEAATEGLQVLGAAARSNSLAAIEAIKKIPDEELRDVMDALISEMRSHGDWTTRPPKWPGASLLAQQAPSCAAALRAFALQASEGKPAPWLKAALAPGAALADGGAG
jgi:predicted KAP-like P-loop ATPase